MTSYPDSSQVLYSNSSSEFGRDFGFAMSCVADKGPEEIDKLLEVKKLKGKWVSLYDDAPFLKKQHFVMTEIKEFNWTGRITEYDTLYGMPDINTRNMSFCLVKNDSPQALCGRYVGPASTQKAFGEYKFARKKIIDVLRSIVFVDGPTDAFPATSASSTK